MSIRFPRRFCLGAALLATCLFFSACSSIPGTSSLNPASSSTSQGGSQAVASSGSLDPTSTEAMFGNTPNLKCFSIEDLTNGVVEDALQQYDLQEYRSAIDEGRVLDGIGSSWSSEGFTFTLKDVWYEETTDNMIDNDYQLSSDILSPIYVYTQVEVTNDSNADGILYLNGGTLLAFTDTYYMQSAEMIYQDHVADPHPNNTDYGKASLAIGQTETYTVAYHAGSGFLTYSPVYLHLNTFSADSLDYQEIYIKLPTLEKR